MPAKYFILPIILVLSLLPVIVPAQNDKPKPKLLDGEVIEEGKPAPSPAPSGPSVENQTQTVTPLKEFSVALPSNPSTGFGWKVATYDRNYLQLLRRRYQKPAVARPGAGGQEFFDFLPLKSGTSVIVLHYQRPFEKQVAQEKRVTVVIQ